MIIYNKLDNYFVVSADRQTFLGFEMTANLADTSPLRCQSCVCIDDAGFSLKDMLARSGVRSCKTANKEKKNKVLGPVVGKQINANPRLKIN